MPKQNQADKEEQDFQAGIKKTEWFKEYVKEYGEEPDLNTKDYDYRSAWKAGVRPQRDPYDKNRYHWSSSNPETGEMLKSKEHPTAWKEEYMKQTGKNPDEAGITKEQAGMAKGGAVKAKLQTKKLLQEGGMLQEGGTVDEESGNEVPVGAMQEEVRDDIPAKLSEGEFVFPADVVRYIGLERLMQMRQAAKEGLKKMEDMGQMSNADEATEEDDGEFESQLDEIFEEVEGEDKEETEMQVGGMARKKVGEPTGEMSEAGRPLYKTAEGEIVSEKSITVPYKDGYVNVPSIQDGIQYEEDEIEDMLASGKVKPTSTHNTLEEAVEAAKQRSNSLIKMQVGGMAMPEGMTQEDAASKVPELTPEQMQYVNETAKRMKEKEPEIASLPPSNPTEGLTPSSIIKANFGPDKQQEADQFIQKVEKLTRAKRAINIRHNDTVIIGFIKGPGVVDPFFFSNDTPEKLNEAITTGIEVAKKAGIKTLESDSKGDIEPLTRLGYDVQETEKGWSLDIQ